MTSTSSFVAFSRTGATLAIMAAALAGCSTVKSIVPMGSSVPYAQSIKPTIPQPAITEIPAFKAAPKPPPKPVEPAIEPAAPAAAPLPAPAVPAAQPSVPPPPAAEPKPRQPSSDVPPPPAPTNSQSSLPSAGSASAADARPTAATPTKPAQKTADAQSQQPSDDLPSVPEERRAFHDDGNYPNLAQVPARPVNLPTFADAASLEKLLQADSAAAKQKDLPAGASPASASKPEPSTSANATVVSTTRAEDRAPCLNPTVRSGDPTVTVHFKPGSSALTAGELAILVDALPAVRGGNGTIRIFGHGDTDPGAPKSVSRFDLAVARAGAVALALAGYGVPTPRMAVGVACVDTAMAGASVQLYAES